MTQIGGIDVLIAWCEFAVILLVFGWLILRHHRSVRGLSREDLESGAGGRREPDEGDAPPGAPEGR